jgi:Post-segregation antitoxin CcdA.
MTKSKMTLSIEEHHYQFAKETGINVSKLLRKVIDAQIDDISQEEFEVLRAKAGKSVSHEEQDKIREELSKIGISAVTRDE